jgi:vesicle-fusing ATPase
MLSLSGDARNNFIEESFTKRVGGLQTQIQSIVRRVLDGRVFRAFNEDGELDDQVGLQSWKEANELEALGLTSVKGLLLYGKPGTGKTLLAREISNALRSREPKIVSAPELLDRWVGGSEKLIRALFIDAENELKDCNGDASKSSLHVIIIDEIDAVFRKRSASDDSAQVTRASAVNQILAKLDGVEALPNVLLIGMTNRKELLDEALLRPGKPVQDSSILMQA